MRPLIYLQVEMSQSGHFVERVERHVANVIIAQVEREDVV